MKYIDLIAYPIMILVVYVMLGLVSWDKDPATWTTDMRMLWIVWATVWGYMLQYRIKKDCNA